MLNSRYEQRYRRAHSVGTISVLLVVLLGCSGSQATKVATTPGGVESSTSSLEAIVEADRRYLNTAEIASVAACMRASGFEFETSNPNPKSGKLFSAVNVVELDASTVATKGYDLEALDLQTDQHNETGPSRLSPAELARYTSALNGNPSSSGGMVSVTMKDGAVFGVPSGGCWARARSRIYGSLEQYLREDYSFQQLDRNITQAIVSSKEFGAMLAEWSTCMKNSGFAFETPSDAITSVREAYGSGATGSVLPIDIATASADEACQNKAKMVQHLNALNGAITLKIVEQNYSTFLAYSQFLTDSVRRSKGH